jgi:hypothetical protein
MLVYLGLNNGGRLALEGGGYLLLNSSPLPSKGGVSYQDIERYLKFIEEVKEFNKEKKVIRPQLIKKIKRVVKEAPIELKQFQKVIDYNQIDDNKVEGKLFSLKSDIDKLQSYVNKLILERQKEEEMLVMLLLV